MRTGAFAAIALAVLSLAPVAAEGEPYLPRQPSEVLERLPARSDPAQRELTRMRALLQREPANAPLATSLARRYIALARREGDPRYLGYAQAVLRPWWQMPKPPPEVQLLRATILQSTHRFDLALRDLDALVQADSGNVQAWLTRAMVQQVTGDFAGARASCGRLAGRAAELVVRTCQASVNGLNGAARHSYRELRAAYAAHRGNGTEVDTWVQTLLGEMAARLGEASAAHGHFKAALALAPTDNYLLGAYADFLLDQGQPAAVDRLLRGKEKADALLLRRAIALDQLRSPEAATARATLRARLRAAQMRADAVHQREHARQALQLEREPARALQLARANWLVQKEPADLRILLESAVAARDAPTIAEALAWIDKQGLEDVALAPLRSQAATVSSKR